MKKKVKFLTYQQQLDNLRDHGLIVTNDRIGTELLQSRGYYNLINRYKEDLYRKGQKEYPIQTTLEDLYKYHRIEDDLRNILFRFTLNVEQRLKENISYALASNFGVDPKQYLNPHNFNLRHASRTSSILYEFERILSRPRSEPLRYYKNNYDVVPPWILLNDAMLGETRMLFGILPFKLKIYIIKSMLPVANQEFGSRPKSTEEEWNKYIFWQIEKELKQKVDIDKDDPNIVDKVADSLEKKFKNKLVELFSTMIHSINDFRNALAHGDRIVHFKSRYNLKYKQLYSIIEVDITKKRFDTKNLGNGIYGILIVLMCLLDKYDALLLIRQLKDWQYQNTRTYNDRKTYNLFIKNCNLPRRFTTELEDINHSLHYYSTLNKSFPFLHDGKYADYD